MDRAWVKRWSVKVAGGVLLLAVMLLIGLSGTLLWLSGGSGRIWLAGQVENLASTETARIDIGAIEKLDTGTILIDRITVADAQGRYLTIDDLLIDYRFLSLLDGNPRIDRLMAERVVLERLPEQGKPDAAQTQADFRLPDIHIGRFGVGSLELGEAITGTRERLQVEGRLVLSADLSKSDLALRVVDETAPAAALVDITLAPGGTRLTLRAALEDRGQGPLSHLTGVAPLRLRIEGEGPPDGWSGRIEGEAGELFSVNSDLAVNLAGPDATVTLSGEWRAPPLAARGETGFVYDGASGDVQASFTGDLHLPEFAATGVNLLLGAGPESALFGTLPARGLRLRASGSWDALRGADGEVFPFAAETDFFAAATLRDSQLEIGQLGLNNTVAALAASGTVDLDASRLTLETRLTVDRLSSLSGEVRGNGRANLTLAGTYAPLQISGSARVEAGALETPWEQAADLIGPSPEARAEFTLSPQGLRIDEGTITGKGIEPVLFEGQIGGEPLAAFTVKTRYREVGLGGRIVYAPPRIMIQDFLVSGAGASAQGNAAYSLKTGAVQGDVKASLEDGPHLSLTVGGTATQPTVSGTLEGAAPVSYGLDFSGGVNVGDTTSATLETFRGQVAGNEFSLAAPLTLSPPDGDFAIDSVRFNVGGGSVAMSGTVGSERIDVRLSGENLPTDLGVPPFLYGGRMVLDANVQGPYDALTGSAQVDIVRMNLPSPDEGQAGAQEISVQIGATYEAGSLSLSAGLTGPQNTDVRAEAIVPMSLVPFNLPRDAPLSGRMRAGFDLGLVTVLGGLDTHRLGGEASLDLQLGGTLANPEVSGSGTIAGGRYENIETGTVLRGIEADIAVKEDALVLDNLRGRGPGGGTVAGQGQVVFADPASLDFTFQTQFEELQLVDADQLGATASGELNVAGGMRGANITGDIVIDQAEYFISRLGGTTSFSGFTIVEKGGPDERAVVTQEEASPWPVTLELGVRADDNIFVRGPDLDTEWAADLVIGGTLSDPDVRGALRVVRGSVQLIDTPIELQGGEIIFNTPRLANPTLDLTGVMRGADLDATVRVTGEAQAPEIVLSSSPPLPEDEILARVLFGAGMEDLTPVQGLQIARTVAALSGRGGGGLDPLGRIRQATGLDALSVGYDEEQGATLSIGKYIGDDVYVAVDQGVTPESSAVRVEIDVTNDIEVETRLGGTAESSVGINWKRDY